MFQSEFLQTPAETGFFWSQHFTAPRIASSDVMFPKPVWCLACTSGLQVGCWQKLTRLTHRTGGTVLTEDLRGRIAPILASDKPTVCQSQLQYLNINVVTL